jgi:hypothetical protein
MTLRKALIKYALMRLPEKGVEFSDEEYKAFEEALLLDTVGNHGLDHSTAFNEHRGAWGERNKLSPIMMDLRQQGERLLYGDIKSIFATPLAEVSTRFGSVDLSLHNKTSAGLLSWIFHLYPPYKVYAEEIFRDVLAVVTNPVAWSGTPMFVVMERYEKFSIELTANTHPLQKVGQALERLAKEHSENPSDGSWGPQWLDGLCVMLCEEPFKSLDDIAGPHPGDVAFDPLKDFIDVSNRLADLRSRSGIFRGTFYTRQHFSAYELFRLFMSVRTLEERLHPGEVDQQLLGYADRHMMKEMKQLHDEFILMRPMPVVNATVIPKAE